MQGESTSKIKIEKNIPMPVRGGMQLLPLDEMEIGDSFLMTIEDERQKGALRQRITRFQSLNRPSRFSIQKVDGKSVRVFRVS